MIFLKFLLNQLGTCIYGWFHILHEVFDSLINCFDQFWIRSFKLYFYLHVFVINLVYLDPTILRGETTLYNWISRVKTEYINKSELYWHLFAWTLFDVNLLYFIFFSVCVDMKLRIVIIAMTIFILHTFAQDDVIKHRSVTK